MKTTIEVSDNLLEEARSKAKRDGVSLREVFEMALRSYLVGGRKKPFRLADRSVGGRGSAIEGDWKAIRARIYEGRGE